MRNATSPDVKALPPSPEADALLASGVHVYMVVPMIAGGELIGSISFGGETADFPDAQVRIAQEVAAQLAIALRHGGRLATFDRSIPIKAVRGARPEHVELLGAKT